MKKLYSDRGMMKWQGLILAEHAEMMEREVVFKMNTFGDHDLLQVNGIVSEFCRLPGQHPYVKLKGYSSRF